VGAVKIADLADGEGWVIGQTFEDCEIDGPAVLVPSDNITIEACKFPGPFERFAWPLPDRPVFGPVGLRDCTFRRCTFTHRVGIASSEEFLNKLGLDLLK
jgi:hypothetical protein